MKPIFQKDKLFIYAGIVTDVSFITKENKESALIKLKDRRGDKISLYFNNSDEKKNADRIRKANVNKGSYISVLCCGEKDSDTVTGLDFKYSGVWRLKGKSDERETTIIHGLACSPRNINDDMFSVSVPIKFSEETHWYEICFYNSENGSKNADVARKILNEKQMCCIRGGEIKTKNVDGKTYYNIVGFGIDLKPHDN